MEHIPIYIPYTQAPAHLDASLIYPDICANMKSYEYTVAALSYFPYVWVRNDTYQGIEMDMVRFLADRNNFTSVRKYEMVTLITQILTKTHTGFTLSTRPTEPGEARTRTAPGPASSDTASMESPIGPWPELPWVQR